MSFKYLKRIDISNFRAYPPAFSLDLPGPGVTLLVGSNGLGKTSFFEAIEWALTGVVERLSERETEGDRSSPSDYYARIRGDGSRQGAFSVKLSMSDHSVLDRQFVNGHEVLAPSAEEVVDGLRSEGTGLLISNVWLYLRQTHFLCQAPERRFTALDPEERWNKIRGPVGVEGLSLALSRLGQGTMNAFTRRINDADRRVHEARAALESWTKVLERRDQLVAQTASSGALSPTEATTSLTLLEQEIVVDGRAVAPAIDATPEALNERFSRVLLAIQSEDGNLVRLAKALEQLRDIPSEWRTVLAALEATEIALQSASRERDVAVVAAEAAAASFSDIQKELSDSREKMAAAEHSHSAIQDLLGAIEDRVSAQRALDTETAALGRMADQLEQHRTARQALEVTAKSIKLIADERRVLNGRQGALRVAEAAVASWREQAKLAKAASSVKADVDVRINDISEAWRALAGQITGLTRQAQGADARASALRSKAGIMRGAVSVIAAELSSETKRCPVCSTPFEKDGTLRAAVLQTLSAADEVLVAAEQEVSRLRESLRTLGEQQEALKKQGQELRAQQLECVRQEQEAGAAWSAVLALPIADSADPVEIENTLNVESRRLDDQLVALQQRQSDPQYAANVGQEIRTVLQAEQSTEQALQAQSDRIRQAQARIDRASAQIGRRADEAAELAEASADLQRSRLKEAADTAAQWRESVAGLERTSKERADHLARVRTALRFAEQTLGKGRSELEAIRAREKGILDSWTKLGFDGTPREVAVDERRRACEARRAVLAGAERARHLLWERWRSWHSLEELEQLRGEITRLRKDRTEVEYSGVLAERSRTVRDEAARIGRARTQAEGLREQLDEKTSRYLKQVVNPLRGLVESYFRALSIFPEWEVQIDASTKRNKTSVGMTVHPTQKAGRKPTNHFSARHLLSEGQLSAVALSQLLAMSTAYRWSRWRALLLDDPLQHNDVIHAAALVDVLRNLVREEKYQIVISTHDMSVADFFRRKLQAGDIPCTTCHFRGIGTDGLMSAVE